MTDKLYRSLSYTLHKFTFLLVGVGRVSCMYGEKGAQYASNHKDYNTTPLALGLPVGSSPQRECFALPTYWYLKSLETHRKSQFTQPQSQLTQRKLQSPNMRPNASNARV